MISAGTDKTDKEMRSAVGASGRIISLIETFGSQPLSVCLQTSCSRTACIARSFPCLHVQVTHGVYNMLAPGSTGVEPRIPRTSRVPSKPHRFRSLTGCLTCRQRKKKCDENRPICVGCLRNKLQCTWPADNPRRIAQNSEPQVAAQDLTNFPVQHDPSAQWSMTTGSFLSPTKVFRLTETSSLLFTHYVAETANVLSTSQSGSNPFLTFLVPLCRNDDLLMHSLLTLSGAHLRSTNPGIEVYLATYRHYSIVIRTIRDCISNHATMDVHQALRVLLTLMILSFFEVHARTLRLTPTIGSLMTYLDTIRG